MRSGSNDCARYHPCRSSTESCSDQVVRRRIVACSLLLFQVRLPVEDHCNWRRSALHALSWRYDYHEALAVTGYIPSIVGRKDEQLLGGPQLKPGAASVHIHRHHREGEVEDDLLTCSSPLGVRSAILRELPFAFSQGGARRSGGNKRPDIDFIPASFVGYVGNPAPIRRKARVAFIEVCP